ncbi:MAG: UDP-N-acetylglucosamine 2-epimerase (hydrolyzing) [Candidatus Schekmanbacteria bacterium]|nr:UDP-N-acetylglucosamine 2-epimerase (hydrolyzing) [Candidatus Schekmanbacteria bacterium]
MRKICVITGSRAEYGLLKPLLAEIKKEADLQLQLIATGMHLSPEFGLTYQEIIKDGFNIDAKVEMLLSSDTPTGISKSMGLGLISFAEVYERLAPHIIVTLGDRFEIFSAVAASLISRIPVAHIHGGEITEGAFDDALRHSITKMSHLHFTATEDYRKRVIQLGEQPDRVFNVGALGLDNIKNLKLLDKSELENELKFKFNQHNLLCTYHPVTLENNTSGGQFQNLLDILDNLADTNLIFTKANADTFGRIINKLIDDYVASHSLCSIAVASMGQLKYLSAMQFADAIVGNSSSGIIEAPSFKIGTINIGNRQRGRIKAASIIDCEPEKDSIKEAFNKLYSPDFQKILEKTENPHGDGNSAGKIISVLKQYDVSRILMKKFYDIG